MVASRKMTATRKVAKKTSGAPSSARPIAGVDVAAQVAAEAEAEAAAESRQALSLPVEPAPPAAPAAKQKLVRDSFTIPEAEYEALMELKARLVTLARPTRKSELLRAGIRALDELSDAALIDAVGRIETLKTGRPKAAARKSAKTSKKKR